MSDWKNIAKKSERYKRFFFLEKPVPFDELFKNRDIRVVQVHSAEVFEGELVGFCGGFEWKDGQVISRDGDSYNKGMKVLGYEWFNIEDNADEGITIPCLDILVGNDW